MAYSKITDDMNIIQALPDEPNDVGGLTAAQLKAKFDEAGNKIKTAFNNLVDELNESGTGGGSASEISFERTAGVPEDNVQDAIENVQEQIAGISQGTVADGSITTVKLADNAVTTAKMADGSVTSAKLASGALGWRKLAASEFGIVADTNVSSIKSVDAYYCEALGIVRFQLSFYANAVSTEPSVTNPNPFVVAFDDTKNYRPTVGEYNISGSVNSRFRGGKASTARLESNYGIFVFVYGKTSENEDVEVSGFYYTEDVPSGGES